MSKGIAIVGAGLLGRLLAWRLSEQDVPVTLFEKDTLQNSRPAAHTAAAMISPFSEVVVSNKTVFALGQHSLKLWPQWIEELNASCRLTNAVTYANPGTLALAHPQDQSELLQFKQDLQGILGSQDESQWLENSDIKKRETDLHHFQSALYLPNEAYLDNRQLLSALVKNITANGGNIVENCPIEDCSKPIDNFQPDKYDLIIDCRGLGAKPTVANLRGVRGEVIWIHCPEVNFQHAIRLMHPRYRLYLVSKPNNHYILGATEIESEDLSPISVQSSLELNSALYSIHPAFAEARIIETDVNLRPAFNDNNPKVTINNNVIEVNGLYRHGFLLAPTMVNDIVAWINNDKPSEFWSFYS